MEITANDKEAVEQWAEACNLNLVHDSILPKSFSRRRWINGYNPGIIFVSSDIATLCKNLVSYPIPRTQHRPTEILINE